MKHRLILAAVAAAVLALSLLAAKNHLLWLDELFTYYVSAQPTLRETISALLAGIDIHPPVDFVLRHLSMSIFGRSEVAFRLPSALAMLAGLFALYSFARRRVPFAAALAAMTLPLSTFAGDYAFEGRPYALLFASASLALLAWQRAVDRPQSFARELLLAVSLCFGPFSHYFGILNYLPVVIGEAWRTYLRRRVSWPIVSAILVSTVTLPLLWPFARSAAALGRGSYPEPNPLSALLEYSTLFGAAAIPLLATLIGAFVLRGLRLEKSAPASASDATIPSHEVAAAVTLSLTPLWAFVLATIVGGQLLTRYTIATIAGLALLIGYLIAQIQPHAPRTSVLAVLALITSGLGSLAMEALGRTTTAIPPSLRQLLTGTTPPIVVDNQHVFLRYWHYLPPTQRDRLYYVVDDSAAGTGDLPVNLGTSVQRLSTIVPIEAPRYRDFMAQYSEFYVLLSKTGTSEVLPSLLRDGVCLQLVSSFDDKLVLRASTAASSPEGCGAP